MRAVFMAFALCGLAITGCGNDDSGSFSCDVVDSGGTHTCTESEWTGITETSATLTSSCQSGGGTAVSSCTHTGALGGCKIVVKMGGGSSTNTAWYYTGTAATLMQSCSDVSGTWVNP